MGIIMYGRPILQSILNEVGAGIIICLVFIYIYTRKKNIVLPALIHGLIDFIKI